MNSPTGHSASAERSANAVDLSDFANTSVRALIKRAPVVVPPEASIQVAAQLMREQRVSWVLIAEAHAGATASALPGAGTGRLLGLVTDRDLRNRVIAAGLDPVLPLRRVATPSPLTADVHSQDQG